MFLRMRLGCIGTAESVELQTIPTTRLSKPQHCSAHGFVAGFAVFGVVLSALGVYAVISYSVSQRTREIGIRMALGATADGVRRGILADTGRLAVLGLALGLPVSWMAARAIRGLLYDVGSFDAVTFGATLVSLVVVAGCAGYLPARRATRVDPVLALKPR